MLACVVQVYFEQFLPIDSSWPAQFGLEAGAFRVLVAPRRPGDDLFPEDIDRTMSTMEFTLTPMSTPGGRTVTRVGERVLDRIGLTVIDDSRTPEPMSLLELDVEKFVDTALDIAAGILSHCRVMSASPWIRGVQREFRPQDQRLYTLNPHTVTWFAADDATALSPLPVNEGNVNAHASSGAMRSPEPVRVPFQQLSESLKIHGRDPDVVRELLVTAEERLIELQLRESIVAIASALEVASEAFADRHPTVDLRDIRRDRFLSFAKKQYAEIPTRIVSRSLAAEHPDAFTHVEAAYRARNNVAHAGRLSYREASGMTIEVDRHLVQTFLTAARCAVTWLDELPTPAHTPPAPTT